MDLSQDIRILKASNFLDRSLCDFIGQKSDTIRNSENNSKFQQKRSPYENFSFLYQFRLDESLILSKEEKEKKNLLNMWEKTTLIFTWNNKPSTYYYIYIVESQDVKQTFGFCILEEIGHSRELYNLCVCDVS